MTQTVDHSDKIVKGLYFLPTDGGNLDYFPDRSGEIGIVDRRYPYSDVRRFGATGTGSDETTKVQNGLTSVLAAAGPATLKFPAPAVSWVINGSLSLPAAAPDVTIEGIGQRRTKISTTTATSKMFVIGTDDGDHAGASEGYDGGIGRVRFKKLWLEGPNTANPAIDIDSVAVTDWEAGSAIFEDCFISKFGFGYGGLGADVQSWRDTIFSFNGQALALYSRSDLVDLYSCYFTQNAVAVVIESSYAVRVYGGTFVGNTTADIIVQAPATASLPPTSVTQTTAPDKRPDVGVRIHNTYHESFVGAGFGTTRHIWIGKGGASGRTVRDVQISGAQFLCAQTTDIIEVDAASDVKIFDCDVKDGAVVSGSWIKINTVAGVNQYVSDRYNRVPTNITRVSGTVTFYQQLRDVVGGNYINQLKANNPRQFFNTPGNKGLGWSSDGSALMSWQRNTGTSEDVPTYTTFMRINNGNIEEAETTLTWGGSIAVQANSGKLFRIAASSNIAATVAVPTSVPAAGFSREMTLLFKNTSGGALTTLIAFTGGAGGFVLTGGAWVNPTAGKTRGITFEYSAADGLWYEKSRWLNEA